MKLFSGCKGNQYNTITVTDFRKLNPVDFYYVHGAIKDIRKEIILCSYDGRLFVNKKFDGADLIYGLFNSLIHENVDTLQEYAKEYGKLFPYIKTFDDWLTMKDTDLNKVHALAVLCVPIEKQRREIMSKYFNNSTYKNT